MNKVYLLIGGNMGDRKQFISKAKEMIAEEIGVVKQISSIYETEPWGFKSEQSFYNQVVEVLTGLTPGELLKKCWFIENKLDRKRKGEGYSSRTMDVDILFYNQEIIQSRELIIPHKMLHERLFTLMPLQEIAPDLNHPVLNKTITIILADCKDYSDVKKLESDFRSKS